MIGTMPGFQRYYQRKTHLQTESFTCFFSNTSAEKNYLYRCPVKRFVAFLLMCLFAANICGASITHHLCGKKSQYVSLAGKKKHSKCCCSGGDIDKGCCKTKHIKVKLDDEQTIAKSLFLSKSFLFEATPPTPQAVFSAAICSSVYASVQQLANPPPLLAASLRLHVLYQAFLI